MDITILWSIFIVTISITTIIVVAVLIPTLIQLTRTLNALEKISLQWHKDFEPAIKELADITLKANNSLKKIEYGFQIVSKIGWVIGNSSELLKIGLSKLIQALTKEYSYLQVGIKKGVEVWEKGNTKIKGVKELPEMNVKEK